MKDIHRGMCWNILADLFQISIGLWVCLFLMDLLKPGIVSNYVNLPFWSLGIFFLACVLIVHGAGQGRPKLLWRLSGKQIMFPSVAAGLVSWQIARLAGLSLHMAFIITLLATALLLIVAKELYKDEEQEDSV